jgi:hypothetical protein
MIAFEQGLVRELTREASVSQYIGDRISDGPPRQTEAGQPYMTYRIVGRDNGRFMSRRNGLANLRYQLEIWDTDPERCARAAAAVEDCLDGFRGWLGGCHVLMMTAVVEGKDDEPEGDDSDIYWHRRRLEVEARVSDNRPGRPKHYEGG